MRKKIAIITGIAGQDGSFLAELLLKKNYEVHGIIKKDNNLRRISHILKKIKIHYVPIQNYFAMLNLLKKIRPNEIYHLAGKSLVHYTTLKNKKITNIDFSPTNEFLTMNTNIAGTHNILAAIKSSNIKSKFYFSGSSEMFGHSKTLIQDENTNFNPRSTYGISKVAGYNLSKYYRDSHALHASTGIMYNHESERRGEEFVTRKISISAAKIKLGLQKFIELGNIDAKRDWGYAPEYVQAMWMMLQAKNPDDYVIGTGKLHTVQDFIKIAFLSLDLNYEKYLKINKKLIRPKELFILKSNSKKILKKLNWKAKTDFKSLVSKMVVTDYNLLKSRH